MVLNPRRLLTGIFYSSFFMFLKVEPTIQIQKLDEQKERHEIYKLRIALVVDDYEARGQNVKINRRERGESIGTEARYGNRRDAFHFQSAGKFYDNGRLSAERNKNKQVVFSQRIHYRFQLAHIDNLENQNLVAQEKPLHFLQDVALNVAGRKSKNISGIANQADGISVIEIRKVIESFVVELPHVLDDVALVIGGLKFFKADHRFKFAEAAQSQFFCEAHNRRARYRAGICHFVN